jgi:hypothetical protein
MLQLAKSWLDDQHANGATRLGVTASHCDVRIWSDRDERSFSARTPTEARQLRDALHAHICGMKAEER